jgi:hypothetical protein
LLEFFTREISEFVNCESSSAFGSVDGIEVIDGFEVIFKDGEAVEKFDIRFVDFAVGSHELAK